MDEFTDLLLSFSAKDKVKLNVVTIVGETMNNKADEIAEKIMDIRASNNELDVVIDRLSYRDSTYSKIFAKYKNNKSYLKQNLEKNTKTPLSSIPKDCLSQAKKSSASREDVTSGEHNKKRAKISSKKDSKSLEMCQLRSITKECVNIGSNKVILKENKNAEKKIYEKDTKSKSVMFMPDFEDMNISKKNMSENHLSSGEKNNAICNMPTRDSDSTSSGLLSQLRMYVKQSSSIKDQIDRSTLELSALDEILFKVIQCKICGLRYAVDEKEILSLHLLDHQRKVRANEIKDIVSRDYLSKKRDWMVNKLNLPSIKSAKKLIASDKSQICKICSKKICLNWSDESDQWILDGAVEVGSNIYCHRKCVE